MKFSLALMQVGLGFLALVWGASYAGVDHKVPLIFLMLAPSPRSLLDLLPVS